MGFLFDSPLAALGRTIFGDGANSFSQERIPMTFTSTLRLRALDPTFDLLEEDLNIRNLTTGSDLLDALDQTVIAMSVNPKSIKWSQPKRIVKRDVQEGSVFYHFTNSKGENNDILKLSFSGNTGNINIESDLIRDNDAQTGMSTGAIQKARTWFNLWNLTRERILLDDGKDNDFFIIYTSPIITYPITLIGFFDQVLDWTDAAEKPNSKDYTFSFTVKETSPPVDELLSSIQTEVFDPAQVPAEV